MTVPVSLVIAVRDPCLAALKIALIICTYPKTLTDLTAPIKLVIAVGDSCLAALKLLLINQPNPKSLMNQSQHALFVQNPLSHSHYTALILIPKTHLILGQRQQRQQQRLLPLKSSFALILRLSR